MGNEYQRYVSKRKEDDHRRGWVTQAIYHYLDGGGEIADLFSVVSKLKQAYEFINRESP